MERIRDNITYQRMAHCPTCNTFVEYHVTDIKGVVKKYIICHKCGTKINLDN